MEIAKARPKKPSKKSGKKATLKKSQNALKRAPATTGTLIKVSVWEQDPASGNKPDGGAVVQVPVPDLNSKDFAVTIINPSKTPPVKLYQPGTDGFRYYTASAALSRASGFWGKVIAGTKWQKEVGAKLKVNLDEGEDFNAYYNRAGLSFFHGTTGGRTVFSGESPDVVCHEHGHAILDAVKPQLWDAASVEAAAFHESFGDMGSLLSALQLTSVRKDVISETGGVIYKSTKLSRLAEQLGWAIRQDYPTDVDPDCLRNAVNSLFYKDPHTIPTSAPASSLSTEPHSFSRVFTSAFFEGLALMFQTTKKRDEADLLKVSQDMGRILLKGVQAASVVPGFYSEVAAGMVIEARGQSPAYAQALKSAFVHHGILTLASVNIALHPNATRGFSASAAAAAQPEELPKVGLSLAEYGLGVDRILVHAASEPRRFNVSGAALAVGGAEMASGEDAARSFVEGLLRRGKLKLGGPGSADRLGMAVSRPNASSTHETFTHELRKEDDQYVLKRVRIDCGFHE